MSNDIVDRLPPSPDWDEQLIARLGNEATSVEGVFPSIADALCQAASVLVRLRSERDALQAKVGALDALHSDPFTEEGDQFCHECVGQWPCRTHRILHPDSAEDGAEP